MIKPYFDRDGITIYHGDCFEIMPELETVDLVLTDPPYNCGKDYRVYKDRLKPKAYDELIANIVNYSNGNMVVLLGSQGNITLPWWKQIPSAKLIVIQVKAGGMPLRKTKGFRNKFRVILTTKAPNVSTEDFWSDIRWSGEGYFFNEPNYDHPAIAPLKLMKRCVDIFTNKLEIILDPFMGCGATLVAAKEFNRKAIGIEIEEKYCEIAVKRVESAIRLDRMSFHLERKKERKDLGL